MAISMIERRSAWYDIYDERGKKQKTLSESIGDVLGWAANFFVVRRSAWYDLYDESGKKYKTLSESIGSFVSISGDTFIVRRSAWLDTYDRTGKKLILAQRIKCECGVQTRIPHSHLLFKNKINYH